MTNAVITETDEALSPSYQKRLLEIVEECQHKLDANGEPKLKVDQALDLRPIREIERQFEISGLTSRLSWWSNRELKRPISAESIMDLARIDPYERTPGYLKAIIEGTDAEYKLPRFQDELVDIAKDLDNMSKGDLKNMVLRMRNIVQDISRNMVL